MATELKPHQITAVDELDNGKILYGGTGVGKSITAMAYYYLRVCGGILNEWGSMTHPRDIYVITTAKKRDDKDWETEGMRFGVGTKRDSSTNYVKLTVDSWNNIDRYKDVRDAFFIFDEQRVVGYGAWSKTYIKIAKANQWILLSATPGDTWMDYIPVFIANGWYKNKTEFTREHVVYSYYGKFPKVERYLNAGKLVRLRNKLLVHMPYDSHTVRHSFDVYVDYNEDLYKQVSEKRWHVFEKRPLKDVAEAFATMRKVVNTDPSRLQKVRELMEKHPRLIIFYNFDYELEMLRSLAHDPFDVTSDSQTSSIDGGPRDTRVTSLRTSTSSKSPSGATSTLMDTSHGMSDSLLSSPTTSLRHSTQSSSTTTVVDSSSSSSPAQTVTSLRAPAERTSESWQTRKLVDATPSNLVVAEWNGHKHEPVPTTDRWIYLVQYAAGSEGWNCITTNATIFFSQTYSYKHHQQAHGRTDRMNTSYIDQYYYHLLSKARLDQAIRRSLKAKRNFNESASASSFGLKAA